MSVVLLALVAQLDPVDLLAPLATMDPRYVLSSNRKKRHLKCTQRSIFLILILCLIIEPIKIQFSIIENSDLRGFYIHRRD